MDAALGPLKGIKIIELAGVGPAPMCAMLLADLGADVLRIERLTPSNLGVPRPRQFDLLLRGRQTIALDLKNSDGKKTVLKLIERSDVLIEGYRPGVAERLGVGYDVYECADGRFASVPPIEHKSLVGLVSQLGPPQAASDVARNVNNWPQLRQLLSDQFKSESLDHWCRILEGTDSCFSPVLSIDEAPNHPHLKQRQTFVEIDGIVQPAPARFSRSALEMPSPPQCPDPERTREILTKLLS